MIQSELHGDVQRPAEMTGPLAEGNNTVNVSGYGGNQTSNLVEPRRGHRWMMSILGRGAGQFSRSELLLLKKAARPKKKFTDAKMEHNQETVYFAGRTEWDQMELEWYDVEQNPDMSKGIYQWLGTVLNLDDMNVAHPSQYKKNAVLSMLNGGGLVNEQWTMYGCWPADIDWKPLDYGTSDIQMITVKMRFDRARRDCGIGSGLAPTVTAMC